MRSQVVALLREMGRNLRDLLPILFVIALFQLLVIREPMQELERRVLGAIFSLVGLTLFVRGLGMSIFPLGEGMADWLARRGSLLLLLGFGFALGFGSTIAEPALSAVADQAAHALTSAKDTAVAYGQESRFSLTLRYTVAIAVGIAVAMGVLRVVKGWPIAWFVVPGYLLAIMLALISQSAISAVAFDAGTAATSAINVPLMMALGVGLATMIRERNPLLDGFGVVALASLSPMIVVQLFSLITG